MKRALWTKSALNVGLPYTDVPAYILAPLVPAAATPDAIPSYVAWPVALAISGWFLYLNRRKRRTPGWALRRFRSWLRGGIYHARPMWHVRRMSRPTPPQLALKAAVIKLDDEMAAFGFPSSPKNAQERPAGARTKMPATGKKRTDQSTRKNSQ